MNDAHLNTRQAAPRGGISFWPMLLRRWWLLALATAAVVAAAYAVVNAQSESNTARALTVVPAGSTSNAPGSATDAEQLAATYAALIPEDDALARQVARRLDMSPAEARDRLGVVNTADTALLELTFKDADPAVALAGARALAELATDGGSPNIPPKTLNMARAPVEAVDASPGDGRSSLLLGILLGLFVGAVAMVFLERADARADDPADLEDALGVPATRLTKRTLGSQVALAEHWRTAASHEPASVAFVPVSGRGEAAAESAAEALATAAWQRGLRVGTRAPGEQVREPLPVAIGAEEQPGDTGLDLAIMPTARPGGEPSGESVGISSDVVVMVVRKGDRLRAARERAQALASFGIEVERILFVAGNLRVARDA
jgi:capsular polysaccharide biosynthesis protein